MTELTIERDVPLAPLTTLELGGPARYYIRAISERDIVSAFRWAQDEGLDATVLGGGSNVIVSDAGYDGLVIHMAIGHIDFRLDGSVDVGAGVPWEHVIDGAVTRGLAGLECLTGIPGSTGATPIQNVGAYGQEVSEVIEEVHVIDRRSLQPNVLGPEACQLGYRDSVFKRDPTRHVVCAVRFKLRPGGAATVRYPELERLVSPGAPLGAVRNAVLDLRRSKSMVVDPDDPNRRSVGSFFLNPVVAPDTAERVVSQAVARGLARDPEAVPRFTMPTGEVKLAAGWLIEKSGIAKGTRRGAVGVSSRHALALVHHGGGTTAELLAFAEEIRTRVMDRFGISLEREPRSIA